MSPPMERAGRKRAAISAWRGCGGDAGQQAQLHLARHVEVALQALLFFVDALVEPRVGDGDGDLRGEGGEGASGGLRCSS